MKGKLAMQNHGERRVHPVLKELVVQASQALARLDADRLEELALSCKALNRDLGSKDVIERKALQAQAMEAKGEMAVFARVLEASRANLKVMTRLRDSRLGQLEYREEQLHGWMPSENAHGDN
jgi:hypothetical protein